MTLFKKLQAIKPQMVAAAQRIIDEWEQNEEELDEELGSGGVCDQVSEAVETVISEMISGIEFTDGGHEGDDHAFVIVYNDSEAYAVNIPPEVYEVGGGYSWKKIKGAKITEQDVIITKVDRDLVVDW